MAHLTTRLSFLFLLLTALVTLPASAEIVTLVNGDLLDVDRIAYQGDMLNVTLGTETRQLPRSQVRDIAFSGKKRERDVLATDTQDLQLMLKQGQELLTQFPDSLAILVRDENDFFHRVDGTNVYRIRAAYLLAKEEALGVAQVGLGFDPVRQRIKVLYARSYSPDGEVSALSADQIKISKGSSSGEYFNQNQMVGFTIPGAKVGCVIDYAYEIEEFNPFDKNLFQGSNYFQGQQPVVLSVMRVFFPKDTPLNYKAYRLDDAAAKPVVTEEG
ncbi:MAG TPA: DUF3857 domain-containing protein, partial [Candidatus Ozemobacteraceae bacterium]|nr:DUF3857 domain-containing protein [Candidatus Ozemobacteraceae bacterium]